MNPSGPTRAEVQQQRTRPVTDRPSPCSERPGVYARSRPGAAHLRLTFTIDQLSGRIEPTREVAAAVDEPARPGPREAGWP
jgi:hypothetical protein